jgi:hypothetical protein
MKILSSEKKESGKILITLEIASDENLSFLEQEESLAELLNEAGRMAIVCLLESLDKTGQKTEEGGQVYYRKSVQKKVPKSIRKSRAKSSSLSK